MTSILQKTFSSLSFNRQSYLIIWSMMSLIFITIVVVIVINLSNIRLEKKILQSNLPLVTESQQIINQINLAISQLNEYLLVDDNNLLTAYQTTDAGILASFKNMFAQYRKHNRSTELISQLSSDYQKIRRAAKNIIRLHQDSAANYPGLTLANVSMNPIYLSYLAILEEVLQEIIHADINYESKSQMASDVNELKYYFSQYAGTVRIFLISRDQEQLQDIDSYRLVAEDYHNKVEKIIDDMDMFTSEDLGPMWSQYQRFMEQLVKIYSTEQWRQDTWQMKNFILPKLKLLQDDLEQFSKKNREWLGHDIGNLSDQYRNVLFISLLTTLLISILGFFSVRLIRAIIKPTMELGQFIRGFSFFNPTQVPEELLHHRNEIGNFSCIFNSMLQRLVETYETDKQIRLQMEYQWQALIQHELVLLLKPEGTISYLNGLLTKLIGYEENDVQGLSFYSLFHSTKNDSNQEMISSLKNGNGWTGNVTVKSKQGDLMHLNLTIMPYLDLMGNATEFLAIGSDISLLILAQQKIEENNRLLEHRVAERTQELLKANEELDHSYKQLLQSEKMASVGQLAAGVAHEINNPVGYVSSNLGTLQQYLDDLFALLQSYEQRLLEANGNQQFVEQEHQKFDFEYIKEDVPAIIRESNDGLERVKIIVQDLKNFSHADSGEWHETDINEVLDSTLNVAHNKLKYVAKVEKNYGQIPMLNCNQSQLSQVFLNLIINAAQAIEKFGTIIIRTEVKNNQLVVSVKDTGKGIPADILDKIFDPFYTTKPVGTGTGLGLSLSYGIVEKHQGSIEAFSELGKGSTFFVKLPLSHHEEEAIHGRR